MPVSRYHFPKMIPRRWPFYVFTIASALFQAFLALNPPPYDISYLSSFSIACAILGIFTCLWIATLLCYARSEADDDRPPLLSRCYAHIFSFTSIGVLWLSIGIFLAIHADIECHRHSPACMPLWFSTLLAFLTFLSSCLCISIVICPIAITGAGYHSHVEHARERARESDMERAQQTESADLPVDQISRPPPTYSIR